MSLIDLNSILLPFGDISPEEAFDEGRKLYAEMFSIKGIRGTIQTWHGEEVVFFADRYDHAFKTSPDRARRAYSKAKVSVPRIERMPWIKEILEGRVPDTECRHVPNDSGAWEPPNYLVLAWEYSYIIWLNGLRNGSWKFSSAYPTTTEDMRRYTKISSTIWKREKENAP